MRRSRCAAPRASRCSPAGGRSARGCGRTRIRRGRAGPCRSRSTSRPTEPSPFRSARSTTRRPTSTGTCARSIPTWWRSAIRARPARVSRAYGSRQQAATSTSPTAGARGARRPSSRAQRGVRSSWRSGSCARTCAGWPRSATSPCTRPTRSRRGRLRPTTSSTFLRSRSRRSPSRCRACPSQAVSRRAWSTTPAFSARRSPPTRRACRSPMPRWAWCSTRSTATTGGRTRSSCWSATTAFTSASTADCCARTRCSRRRCTCRS